MESGNRQPTAGGQAIEHSGTGVDLPLPSIERALGGQYRIERELGRGGMGIVYLARDLTLDRRVAVKVLQPELSTNRALAARFLAEARAIAKLRHPNIVAVHSAGEVDGQLYYVMDYLAGETLRQRLTRVGQLSVGAAVAIATDIAAAIDAASAGGIVHRDLKPENILLEGSEEEPRALLADFGIARLVEGGEGHTGPGAVMGTPAYMSPEQAAGEPLDGRSDLYSLGIVTYEMVAGAPPFSGPHRAVISKQILDPVTPLEQARSGVPTSVSSAVMRALDKVADARWASGKSFARALAGDPAARPPRARRRYRWPAVAVAAALVLTLGVALTRGRIDRPPPGVDPRHSILVLPFDNIRNAPAWDWLRDGSANMLILALSQWQDLQVVDPDRMHDLIETTRKETGPIGLEQARRLARASKAWTVVLGDYTSIGDSLRLVARTYDVASGKRLDVVQVDGDASEDVRPLFDELSAKLLDLTGAPKNGRSTLAAVTTQSVEAYRAYLRGADALNHWRLAEASAELERAAKIDTTFSLANYKLAVVRGWISPSDTLGVAAIRRASRTSEHLPARDRQLIDAYQTFITGDMTRGADLYEALIRRDSSDTDAWYGMADAAFHAGYLRGGDPSLLTRSLRAFKHVIALDSSYALAYEHIGAMLLDASSTGGLTTTDSIMSPGEAKERNAGQVGIERARREAVDLAQAWVRFQPSTPRAHYHLYKAYLAGQRPQDARQALTQLKALFPDSLQAFFSLLDARAQLVGGDILGATRTVRSALPRIRPTAAFRAIDIGNDVVLDAMTGIDALGYFGDLQSSAQLIRVGRGIWDQWSQAADSTEKANRSEIWELSRMAMVQAAGGAQPARLRSLWERGAFLSRNTPQKERAKAIAAFAPAAVGLLIGPASDTTAVTELERLSGTRNSATVRALVAIRSGDTAAARQLLAEKPAAVDSNRMHEEMDERPLLAEAHFELGNYGKVLSVLANFGPSTFSTRGLDTRWILLPRIRLLRAAALEHLDRPTEAAAEYRAVVQQWEGADDELLPVVQRARQGLARVEGVRESR